MAKWKLSTLVIAVLGVILILIGLLIYYYKQNEIVQILPLASASLIPSTISSMAPNAVVGQIAYAKVTRVIDGDTVVIDTGEHVRYIGVNTPELESNECYATEASEINKNLVLGKTVKLVRDISETDKYGRLLRFVYLQEDPTTFSGQTSLFVDDYLVKDGAAKIDTILPDIEFKDDFLSSENYAKENKLGLWRKCTN